MGDNLVHLGHQLDVPLLQLRAPELHMELASLDPGIDADGVVPPETEGEIRPAPAHGGIEAVGQVGLVIGVIRALQNLLVRQEGAVVKGAGELADAAPHLLHQIPVQVGVGDTVALLLRPLPQGGVVGEDLARQEDGIVYALRRQADVLRANLV